ncbi:cupin domain-containing protein [Caproicibacter fermentans]|uniref:Cupin domain-containing protein n=1 Tax=Caproicibacter fermentans TaxID=2576756 RepID=A0A7G8TFP0_9FIRM|nr:cupin domain-containing protein [Caproicibacter fermentans]QNK42431.1 cupin domain-containing protein [Caproicibacter fermentans]
MSNAGASRGNHYHEQNEEAFYIINGEVILFVQKGKIQGKYSSHTGDMYKIPRDVLHSFKFETYTLLASMYSHGVEMSDGTKDIFK